MFRVFKFISGAVLSVFIIGCSNQPSQPYASVDDQTKCASATPANINSGIVTIMTKSNKKYITTNGTGLIKSSSYTVGPEQQFYFDKNTNSFKSLLNNRYITVRSDQKLDVSNSSIGSGNQFILNQASSSDLEQVWINYQNDYKGWFNSGTNYVALGSSQTVYKIAVNKIYGSSADYYDSLHNEYWWYDIFLQNIKLLDGEVIYKFYADGSIPVGTIIQFILDDTYTTPAREFYNGVEMPVHSTSNGIFQHNSVRIKLSRQCKISYFDWTIRP